MSVNGIGNGNNWTNASITASFSGQVKPKIVKNQPVKEDHKPIPEEIKPVSETQESTFADLLEAENQKKHELPKAPEKQEEKKPLYNNSSFDMMLMDRMLNKK